MPGKRQPFTAEDKIEAIRMVIEGGRPVTLVADELGVNARTLHNWVSRYKPTLSATAGIEAPLDQAEPDSPGVVQSVEDKSQIREEVLRYLYDTRSIMHTYHNHKETFAWASVVLFVGAASILPKVPAAPWYGAATMTSGILIALVVAIAYARRQFNLREYAARVAWAVDRLILRIISRSLDQPDLGPETLRPPDPTNAQLTIEDEAATSTRAVGGRLAEACRVVFPSRLSHDDNRYNMPPLLVDEIPTNRVDRRIKQFESIAYSMMTLAALAGIAAIWT